MDLGFLKAVLGLNGANFAVSLAPVPNWNGDASENEM